MKTAARILGLAGLGLALTSLSGHGGGIAAASAGEQSPDVGTRSFVTWVGWDHSEDSWLDADEIRPYVPKTWPVGARVRILWEDQWYPGEVLRNELGLQLVHYDGYDQDDEWVDPARLKPRQASVFH